MTTEHTGERTPPQDVDAETVVRTFLIADVRGYTRFTQEHGDEAAGRLAARFAELAREAVVSFGGEVIELRGDEALCVFNSARNALRAAVELQMRFRRQTDDGPAFPLPIGIGLDAGEAVPIEGGYRGSALNTAARLCSLAGPGQVLATDTVVSLSSRLEGIRFVPRRPVRLKGLEKPVRVIEVVPEVGLPPLPVVALKKRARVTRGRLAIAAIAGAALLAAMIALVLIRSTGPDALAGLEPHAIGLIDAEAGIASQLKLDSAPSAIAAGGGFVWTASEAEGTVSRFDPELRTVQTLTLGGSAGGIAYGAGSLWVTNSEERALVQINPNTSTIVQTLAVGNGPGAVAVGKDAVWVANAVDGTVSRIDLARGSVTDTIPVGPSPAGVAVGAGAVWITSEGTGTAVRIDPASHTIVQAVNVGNGPTAIAVGEGGVWVANSEDGTVSRIDPTTNSVNTVIRVGSKPSAVAAGPEAIWVASSGDGTIIRIDPQTDQITETLRLGSSPSGLTLAGGKLWASTLLPLAGHRGGVLRVESDPSGCPCDPALWPQEGETGWNLPPLLYDGLVAYRRVAGVAGGRLVPNLAVRLPTPTDEGRTYSFQLRRSIHYSSGAPVRASDFRFSLERLLTINPNLALFSDPYQGIIGATKCRAGQGERCDLSKGIEVDDGAGMITIHLTEPDPEFLYKLVLPFASVVPAGTPLRTVRAQPIPGTGPYRVASFNPDREIRLVRNERFRVWSPDARPDGYPDEIRFHLSDEAEAGLVAVEKGTADWVSLTGSSFSPERQRGVLTRYADRLHIDPLPSTFWLFLNTRVPPFDDLRVRKALNYATDRKALVERTGGLAETTCQILPPSFPGYRPYCPYTRNPNRAGTWSAPDLAKARALVAGSGTAGMRVEVVGFKDSAPLEVSRYLVSLLRQLGYRSTLRLFPGEDYFAYIADSRNRAQIGPLGWIADTLAASNFFRPLFTCASFVPESPANQNFFQHCDPRLDAKMKQAASLQASDPVRANELWAEVDHALVDRAVVVPWGSPRDKVLLSERVGNYQHHPLWGTLWDQLWVK